MLRDSKDWRQKTKAVFNLEVSLRALQPHDEVGRKLVLDDYWSTGKAEHTTSQWDGASLAS